LLPPALSSFTDANADLIHCGADYGLFLKRRGVPMVATVHNYTSDRFMRPFSSGLQYLHYRTDLRWFTRQTLQTADAVVVISAFMARLVREDLGISRPLRLIYNGVDEQRFTPAMTRRTPGPFRVLFCGNLMRRKRADLLVPLADALGSGFEICYTAGLARAATLHQHPKPGAAAMYNLGQVRHADMPDLYRRMDLLFMPSVREGFGLCVAEAMACGLPIVACRESAMPELVVEGQGGRLCPIDDLERYATAVRELTRDPAAAQQMGAFNRARVEDLFTLDRMVREYKELFEAVRDGAVS
jgi:glycosyltransferase involved in cell wall biosynthesis